MQNRADKSFAFKERHELILSSESMARLLEEYAGL
jgi:hypothetical protein